MKTEHTPGPWKAVSPINSETSLYWTVIAGSEGHNTEKDICVIHCGPPTTEANARLIASAPETAAERDRLKEVNADLLAALEELEDIFQGLIEGNEFVYDSITLDPARSAISKAKGSP